MADQDSEENYPFLDTSYGRTGSSGGDPSEDTDPLKDPGDADVDSAGPSSHISFDAPSLDDWLAAASEEELDDAPFGLIRVDSQGIVQFYNHFESDFAGVAPSDARGKNFFTEVAPCSNNSLFYGRFKKLRDRDAYDDRFNYTFTYKMRPTLVHVRMMDDADGRHWIVVNPQ